MDPSVVIILAMLVLCAFASGMEIAYVSSNRLKVELDISKGTYTGKLLALFYRHEGHFLATLLLVNTIGLVVFGMQSADLLEPIVRSWGVTGNFSILLLQTVISTLVVLTVAEFLPKVLFQINPNTLFKFGAVPMLVLYWLLYLPTKVIVGISTGFLKIFGLEIPKHQKVFSRTDLQHFVADVNERMEESGDLGNEIQMLQNALDFSSIKARDCMVPRMEMVSIDVNASIQELHALFVASRLSKLLVYRDSVDNVIGYVHSFELFKQPETLTQLLRPISFIPEAMPGKELLEKFTKTSQSIAVVVDEYGGTAGIVTIEDVIEQIFGEIEDEHDDEDWYEEQIDENTYRFSARAEVSYLNRTYNLKLPESESYETLGGLVIDRLESIPALNDRVQIDEMELICESVTDRRIELIRVELNA